LNRETAKERFCCSRQSSVQYVTEAMNMSNVSLESMLAALSPDQKRAALDMLWRDLSANPAELPSPAWHGDVLDARLADPSANPRLPIDAAMEVVKESLREVRQRDELTDEQRADLATRDAELDANPGIAMTWDQIRASIEKKP
jgi:hypothetical protein